MSGRIRIAIPVGDPAGIGPEIALKAALDPAVQAACDPIVVSAEPGDLIEDYGDALDELSPMEVSFDTGVSSEVVPVSFESVVTETGMLQLWCVARDGRRWKLEFNVRERVAQ